MPTWSGSRLGRSAGLLVACAGLRRLSRRSGATDDEVHASLPGDGILSHPMAEWTRAATIGAPPSETWPWLVQMGYHRGGWYTNEVVDRLVWRVRNPNADQILPEYQQIAVGDVIPDGPDYAAFFRVIEVDPGHALVYRSIRHPYRGHPVDATDADALGRVEAQLVEGGVYLDFSWAFVLRETADGGTRLIIRTRANGAPRGMALLATALGLADWFHVTTMFRGIKRRAEGAFQSLHG
jgi:hypothetical protein